MRAAGYEKHKGADGKITYIIDLRITDGELKQIYEELGDATPTDENISATPTFRRIWDCLYPKMVEIDEAERQRLRAAKRKNRLRRLNNWKKMAAERARFYNLPLAEKYRYLITHAVDTVTRGMIDTVQDCVGLIRGMEWGGYRNE